MSKKNKHIIVSTGLFQQIAVKNVHPYKVGSFKLDDMIEALDAVELAKWRGKLKHMLMELMQENKITPKEYGQLNAMIDSPDQESIYMAEQIMNFKGNEEGT